MKPNSVYRRYPLVTIVATFLIVDVALVSVQGQDLGHQVMSTSLAAACAICLVGLLVPSSLGGFRLRAESAKERAAGTSETPLAAQLLIAAAVGGALTLAFMQAGFGGVFQSALSSDAGDPSQTAQRLALVALLCVVTGLFEEGFFRGLVVPCAYERSKREIDRAAAQARDVRSFGSAGSSKPPIGSSSANNRASENATVPFEENPALSAALFSSLLFGLLHASGAGDAFAVATSQGEGAALALAANAALKFLQAGMFGFCMAALFLKRGNIWLAVVLHATFDLLYLGPALFSAGAVPETYLTGNAADMVVLAATIMLILLPCVKSARWLVRGVIPYERFHQDDIRC